MIKFFVGLCTSILMAASLLLIAASPKLAWSWHIVAAVDSALSPPIHSGAIVFVQQVPILNLRQHDIIAFTERSSRQVYLRRLKSLDGKNSLLAESVNKKSDQSWRIPVNSFVGQYRFRIPIIGYFLQFIQTVPGFLLCVGLPSLFIVSRELRLLIRQLNPPPKED